MEFKKKFWPKEFAELVGEKEANINTLRIRARNLGLLSNNESLNEDFLPIWDVAKKLHYDKKVKWDDAIDHALTPLLTKAEEEKVVAELADEPQVSNSIEEKLDEVIFYLKKAVTLLEESAKK